MDLKGQSDHLECQAQLDQLVHLVQMDRQEVLGQLVPVEFLVLLVQQVTTDKLVLLVRLEFKVRPVHRVQQVFRE